MLQHPFLCACALAAVLALVLYRDLSRRQRPSIESKDTSETEEYTLGIVCCRCWRLHETSEYVSLCSSCGAQYPPTMKVAHRGGKIRSNDQERLEQEQRRAESSRESKKQEDRLKTLILSYYRETAKAGNPPSLFNVPEEFWDLRFNPCFNSDGASRFYGIRLNWAPSSDREPCRATAGMPPHDGLSTEPQGTPGDCGPRSVPAFRMESALMRCPECKANLNDVAFESSWFTVTGGHPGDSGPGGNTPQDPVVEGIQECSECGHRFEVSG